MMKATSNYSAVVLLTLFSLVLLPSWSYSADKADSKAQRAAVVNGTVITQADVDKNFTRFENQMSMMGQKLNPDQAAQFKKKVLENLIDRELLIEQTKKMKIKVDDAEVNKQIATLKERFPKEADYSQALQKMGLTEAELKSQITTELSIKKLVDQEVGNKVTITDEDAKKYYDANPDTFKMPERVRASHILIKADPKATDADKAKARERIVAAQKRVKAGEDFAAVAKDVSECPSSAKGGDLDFFQKGQMVKPFEDAAFALKPGEMSGIVETEFGYHIIKVTDKKDASVASFDQVKERLKEHLKQEKVNEQMKTYLAQLRSKAKIEVLMK